MAFILPDAVLFAASPYRVNPMARERRPRLAIKLPTHFVNAQHDPALPIMQLAATGGLKTPARYQRIRALPQAIPAPIAIIATRSPGLSRPALFASSSEIGKEALDVLP
jgi:hypothetical protein